MVAVSVSVLAVDSVFFAGGCRRGGVVLDERRGGREVVVRAVVVFDLSDSVLAVSVVSEVFSVAFSAEGDGLASAVSLTSGEGLGIVAPTDDKRFAPAFSLKVSGDSVFSATGIPPLNGSKVPPKWM